MRRFSGTVFCLAVAGTLGAGAVVARGAPEPPAAPAPAAAPAANEQKYNAAELETLVGPIALYPDKVLASMLPATTFGIDVVAAARYLESKGGKIDAVP